MCWFHMRKCAEEKLAMLANKEIAACLLHDIDILHNSSNELIFDAAIKLFLKKWNSSLNPHIGAYINYFQKEWTTAHKGNFINSF